MLIFKVLHRQVTSMIITHHAILVSVVVQNVPYTKWRKSEDAQKREPMVLISTSHCTCRYSRLNLCIETFRIVGNQSNLLLTLNSTKDLSVGFMVVFRCLKSHVKTGNNIDRRFRAKKGESWIIVALYSA